jgi:hypothetical protein
MLPTLSRPPLGRLNYEEKGLSADNHFLSVVPSLRHFINFGCFLDLFFVQFIFFSAIL